jgi:AcrR family transcriptional regulator
MDRMTPQTRHPSKRLPPGGSVGTANALARRRRSDGEATYRRVLDSAVGTILEKGYYQASSNEIARRADVTWGVIQHQFGSREALMLEVLNDRWHRLQELVATAQISGDTLEDRLAEVLDVLAEHYGKPAHLAQVQILLDLNSNPSTSAATREAVAEHGRQLSRAWRPLFRRALGEAAGQEDLVRYAFNTLRGYLTGNLIARSISTSRNDRVERSLLVQGVAAAIRTESASRGIDLDQSR